MRTDRLLAPFLALGLCLAASCLAQNEKQVTLRFLSFPKNVRPEPVQLRLADGEVIEVKAPSNSLSEPYQVPLMNSWSVGKLELNDAQEGAFVEYGAAPSIPARKQLILLIRKGETNADGLEVVPMDDSADKFGGGEFFFMNAAKVDIAGILGGKKFMLEPGSHQIVKPEEFTKRGEQGMEKVFTQFFFKNASAEAKEFFSSTWPANKKARSMVFFYHDDHTKRLRFHTVRDFIP